MVDWKFIAICITIFVVGCGCLIGFEQYLINDMQSTCEACLKTCHPTTTEEAYSECKVCFMQPLDGEYLKYKEPTCRGE